jgi:site-specific recombinase XerD
MNVEALNRELSKTELEPFAQKHAETKRWLRKIESAVTKDRYTRSIIRYCEATKKNPRQLIELKKNSKDHDAEDLLDEFVETAQKANYPNSMIWDIVIAVKSFYKWNYADLSRGAGKITLVKVRPYRTPDRETLLKFLEGAHIRDKAVITFIASTAISEGSMPQLKWSHVWSELIEKDVDVPHIALMSVEIKGKGKGKYEGIQQHTFLTPYAKKTLLAYKEWRERKEDKPITPEDYLFVSITQPFKKLSIGNVTRIFTQRSKDAGIKFSPHDLRRFVQTGLETARLQPNWIKKILRHKVSGEENPYSQPKVEALRDGYRTALPYLDLSEKPALNELELRKRQMLDLANMMYGNEPEKLEAFKQLLAETTTVEELETLPERAKETLNPITPRRGTVEKDCQFVVSEDKLEDYLKRGFRFVATLPSGKILVSNE